MNLKKFDIALVNFPFTNLVEIKKRPALVINSLEGDNAIFCQITTKRRSLQKYEVVLRKQDCGGDIRFDSYIYLDMTFTLHKSLVHRKLGEIKNPEIKSIINSKLRAIF